jgi:thiamine-monophosphate kinase
VVSAGLLVGSGDDATVVERHAPMVTSVDAVVEGVHFRIPPFTPAQAGAKALAVALSDLAAMGASAREAYVQLGLPERLDREALALADGIGEVAAREGVAIAGGDVSRSPSLFLAVTAVGSVEEASAAVRRDGARPGDALVITGEVGGAAAGLLVLERPELGAGIETVALDALRARQLEPRPRLGAGEALARAGASAMIDVSDGVAADAGHVARASRVGIAIEAERVPVQAGVAEIAAAAGLDPVELALGGGEDYELLASIPPDKVASAEEGLAGVGERLHVIGSVGAGTEVEVRQAGRRREIPGFDQLGARRAPSGPA